MGGPGPGTVEYLRQEARLELARDRSHGVGRSHPEEVLKAWQACLEAGNRRGGGRSGAPVRLRDIFEHSPFLRALHNPGLAGCHLQRPQRCQLIEQDVVRA